jgi:hypothetical protein
MLRLLAKMFHRFAHSASGFGKASLLVAVVALGVTAGVRSASATAAITLGTAANYALFNGVGETMNVNGGFNLTGNLGLAKGYNVNISGSNYESGRTYYDYTTGQGSWSNSGTWTEAGGASINQSMSQAVTDAATAASSAAALAATSGFASTYQNAAMTVNGSSIVIKAVSNLSENVLNISSLSLTNGTITFDDNGYTGAKFIINDTGAFSINATGSSQSVIQGINGASASDIIFNIQGTGSTVSITDTSSKSNSIIGTILAPQRNVNLGGGGTLTGELVAGVNSLGQSYTVTEANTGFNITSFAYVPRTTVKTPEPSSMAIFGTGIAFVFALNRRRRKTG